MRTDTARMQNLIDDFVRRPRLSSPPNGRRPALPFNRPSSVSPDGEPTRSSIKDLRATLEGRYSTLRYAQDPVRATEVLSLLQRSLCRDAMNWPVVHEAGELEGFVLALRDEDRDPAIYRVRSTSIEEIAPLSAVGDPEMLGVQREFATASGLVTVCANLEEADGWAGAHGYRVSVVRASMALYDFHLGCQSMDLVGTIYGGFIAPAVRELLQCDGVVRHPLLAATYAHPET